MSSSLARKPTRPLPADPVRFAILTILFAGILCGVMAAVIAAPLLTSIRSQPHPRQTKASR